MYVYIYMISESELTCLHSLMVSSKVKKVLYAFVPFKGTWSQREWEWEV